MSRSTIVFILVLGLLATLLGWNYWQRPLENWAGFNQQVEPSPSAAPAVVTPSTFEQAQQSVASLLAAPVVISPGQETDLSWPTVHQPAVVTIFGEAIAQTQLEPVVYQLKSLAQPPLIAVDHEGGSVQRLSGAAFTKLPNWQTLCQLTQTKPASASAYLEQSAQELASNQIDIVFAPMLDIGANNTPLKSRICSDKSEIIASAAAQFASVYQSHSVSPVFKHFPGIGQATKDLHQTFDRVTVTVRDAALYRAMLLEFPQAGVMVSHVGVTNQFADVPCSLSSSCVGQLALAYPKVLIFSDALEMAAAGYQPSEDAKKATSSAQLSLSLSERAYKAILAGNDVLVFGPSVTPPQLDQVVFDLAERYQKEPLFAAAVNRANNRISAWKQARLQK